MIRAVVFSDDDEFFNSASGLAQLLNVEEIIGVGLKDSKVTKKQIMIDKLDEEGIIDLIVGLSPSIVILGNTRRDRAIASRIAGRMRSSIITDVLSLEIKDNKLIAERIAYSGMGIAVIEASLPSVITIATTKFKPKEQEDVEVQKVIIKEGRVRVIEKKESGSSGNLVNAQIIVSIGRGIGSKDNIRYAEELANALRGVLGGSRPVTAELKWLPEDRQIGLSGLKVKPKLYIALGISGQPQHIAGIRDSRIIVAVNKDKNAPISEYADYLVVGDCVEFCKALIKKLKERR